MKKHITLFVILSLFATLFAGCTKEVDVTPEVSESETTEEDDLTQTTIEKNKTDTIKLYIYCEEDQPREFINQDGVLSGMSVELVQEIQKRVGNTDEIEMVPWARGYSYVQTEPNVVLFSMARNAERNNLFQWVGPIDEISYAFYSKSDSTLTINNMEDAKKVNAIGVITDEIREIYLKGQGFTNLTRVNETSQNIKMLMDGRLDLVPMSTDPNEMESEVAEFGFTADDFRLNYVFMSTQLYIAISKETSPVIAKSWNAALEEMKSDGTFEQIYSKYFPGKPLPGPAITDF